MPSQFDKVSPITDDYLEIWNITGVDNEAIAEETLKYIDNVQSLDPRETLSEDSVIDKNAPATKVLLNEIFNIMNQKNLARSTIWGQIHRKYEATALHDHACDDVAWVYYARLPPDSGVLMFSIILGWSQKVDIVHEPKVGQLVLFPGYMLHRVTKNFSDIPRVSIAGNANYINE